MYRFGDSTPFPLSENFIDTLAAVVDASTALYQADLVADEGHRRSREARRAAADELRRLEALSALVQSTLGPLGNASSLARPSEIAAARIVELSRGAIGQARDAVVNDRDKATHLALDDRHRGMCRAALETLFLAHNLPDGEWNVEWNARQEATLLVSLQATPALAIELTGRLTDGDRFAGPLKVADLCPNLSQITIGDAVGERRKTTERLGQLAVLELDISAHGVRLAIGKPGKRAPGLVVARRDGNRAVASWLTVDGEVGGRVVLDDPALDALEELCDAASACLPELVGRRAAMSAATLHGVALDELEHPAVLAEELLAAVAPLVRQMRLRSRVPGELSLKRDVGGDRREELFVPRAALAARFAHLPHAHRRAFEAIGLGDEATVEFRARVARGTNQPDNEATAPSIERPAPKPDPAPSLPQPAWPHQVRRS